MHVAIVAELVDANNIDNITFPGSNSDLKAKFPNNSILIPANYIHERSNITGSKAFSITLLMAFVIIRC